MFPYDIDFRLCLNLFTQLVHKDHLFSVNKMQGKFSIHASTWLNTLPFMWFRNTFEKNISYMVHIATAIKCSYVRYVILFSTARGWNSNVNLIHSFVHHTNHVYGVVDNKKNPDLTPQNMSAQAQCQIQFNIQFAQCRINAIDYKYQWQQNTLFNGMN